MTKNKNSNVKYVDDLNTSKTFTIAVYGLLGVVAAIMTVINIVTHKGTLTIVTAVFAGLCALNILLALISNKTGGIARVLFAAEILVMFTFFLISGNPEGFSAIWIALLPAASLYFFGRKNGTAICAVMLLIMIMLLWLPVGKTLLLYAYSETFCMRFPILFIAFFALAFFLEVRREKAYDEMHRLQEYYRELSARDSLTKLYNRQGMYACLKEEFQTLKSNSVRVAILDIDNFKRINDTYGHDAGDLVLKEISAILASNIKGVICRWGGEEFVAIMQDGDSDNNDLENVRKKIENYYFQDEQGKFSVTVSMGVCKGSLNSENVDLLVANADTALYEAKTTGKNKIVYFNK